MQVVIGLLTIICGIIVLIISPSYWFSVPGIGLWSGLIILIAGILSIFSGKNPRGNGTRFAAMCMVSISSASIAGTMAYLALR